MRLIPERFTESERADSATFSGVVWRTEYLRAANEYGLSGIRLLYQPGARSHWHVHDREQVIVGVLGAGLVFWEGLTQAEALTVGDFWHVTPDVPHWHGATPHGPFGHLAVTAGGSTRWLGPVSDGDYAAALPPEARTPSR
jgi:quercetin dioxygenase-like cupin family protein